MDSVAPPPHGLRTSTGYQECPGTDDEKRQALREFRDYWIDAIVADRTLRGSAPKIAVKLAIRYMHMTATGNHGQWFGCAWPSQKGTLTRVLNLPETTVNDGMKKLKERGYLVKVDQLPGAYQKRGTTVWAFRVPEGCEPPSENDGVTNHGTPGLMSSTNHGTPGLVSFTDHGSPGSPTTEVRGHQPRKFGDNTWNEHLDGNPEGEGASVPVAAAPPHTPQTKKAHELPDNWKPSPDDMDKMREERPHVEILDQAPALEPLPNEPPLCQRHAGMDRAEVPACRKCARLRLEWEDEQQRRDDEDDRRKAYRRQVTEHCDDCDDTGDVERINERTGRSTLIPCDHTEGAWRKWESSWNAPPTVDAWSESPALASPRF